MVIGASGQVGRALVEILGDRAHPITRRDIDLADPSGIHAALDGLSPSAVINAAAYTQVDRAESEEELARTVNAESPGILARWCSVRSVPFIHYSTDYVFDGSGEEPWKEDDPVGPLGAYGRTKLEGEGRVVDAGGRHLIFRTSWVYDSSGQNFLRTMLRLGAERETLAVVDDQHGAPTYARHLAEATVAALERATGSPEFPSGIYHLCNTGETTWCGFARSIFDEARRLGLPLKVESVSGIPTSAYPTPARRPHNSRLDTAKAARALGVSLPGWRAGLTHCIEQLSR